MGLVRLASACRRGVRLASACLQGAPCQRLPPKREAGALTASERRTNTRDSPGMSALHETLKLARRIPHRSGAAYYCCIHSKAYHHHKS